MALLSKSVSYPPGRSPTVQIPRSHHHFAAWAHAVRPYRHGAQEKTPIIGEDGGLSAAVVQRSTL
jgi:hypothetical protein